MDDTLDSIRTAELQSHAKLEKIEQSVAQYNKTGNQIHNGLKNDDRITGDMLSIIEKDQFDDNKALEKNV